MHVPNWVEEHEAYMKDHCEKVCHECPWLDRCNYYMIWEAEQVSV